MSVRLPEDIAVVKVSFLLAPAGAGKTRRCLEEIRAALQSAPEGGPLLFLAPKQATFQLERQLLAGTDLAGYTRLQILSFDRLAEFVLEEFRAPSCRLLEEEGRRMVLRAIIGRKRHALKIFQASARLPGFSQHLSQLFAEFQQANVAPGRLGDAAEKASLPAALKSKLRDLQLLYQEYLDWLKAEKLQDIQGLLSLATEALEGIAKSPQEVRRAAGSGLRISGLWLDGFAEMTPQELDLLAALLPFCERSTLAFCLEDLPDENPAWISAWSTVAHTYRQLHHRLAAIAGAEISVTTVARDESLGRFSENRALAHLERHWANPKPWTNGAAPPGIRLFQCVNPEAEAKLAAREIWQMVRAGGRFRDAAVLVRNLETHHDSIRRVFGRYEIPCFLDRREPVSHHPLAELTRFALRVLAFDWRQNDWFGALKSGLIETDRAKVDRLENEALARGWEGEAWRRPLVLRDQPAMAAEFETLRRRWVEPMFSLACDLEQGGESVDRGRIRPETTIPGKRLSGALRDFWERLGAEEILQRWSTRLETSPRQGQPRAIPSSFPALHQTVWEQMNGWVDNLALAFAGEAMPLREWLPVLESGLAGLTVGVIPPSLDQVLVGAVDRSRNPDLKLCLALGMNEGIFPEPPSAPVMLSESEREFLDSQHIRLGPSVRQRLGQERFYGYVACTRSRRELVLTCASFDNNDRVLNPSPLLAHVQRLFPALKLEPAPQFENVADAVHVNELVAPFLAVELLRRTRQDEQRVLGTEEAQLAQLSQAERPLHAAEFPAAQPQQRAAESSSLLDQLRARCKDLLDYSPEAGLSPATAAKLYGPELRSPVTRLEQFAACPFKFFVHSGLQAEERLRFEADAKRLGDFQHQVLCRFHEQVKAQGKKWRDLSPLEARALIRSIADEISAGFSEGLLLARERERFMLDQLTAGLQDFIETIVAWMVQYQFDPAAVELGFGPERTLPGWKIVLESGQTLLFVGQIDRIDLGPPDETGAAWGIVIDYKSSQKKIDPLLLEAGVQMQLPAYLAYLRKAQAIEAALGVKEIRPGGIFYVSLRPDYPSVPNRRQFRLQRDEARRVAYQHLGRFNASILPLLDNRAALTGDQFNYQRKKDGDFHARCDAQNPQTFNESLTRVEELLRDFGRRIFAGEVAIAPYRKGGQTACQLCAYPAICRFDPWQQKFRVLAKKAGGEKR